MNQRNIRFIREDYIKQIAATHYQTAAIILVLKIYFTSSNISNTDYKQLTFIWYKNVSSIRVVSISKHLGCCRPFYILLINCIISFFIALVSRESPVSNFSKRSIKLLFLIFVAINSSLIKFKSALLAK